MTPADKNKTGFKKMKVLTILMLCHSVCLMHEQHAQRYMNIIIAGLKWQCLLVYLDDFNICEFFIKYETRSDHFDIFEIRHK